MADHLNSEQMVKYRDRQLAPEETVAVDRHLSGCPHCRASVATLISGQAFIEAIAAARNDHLSYEQMDAWVENQLDPEEREFVMAHAALCQLCARQLRAYESYAPAMSARIPPPAREATRWTDRLLAFFRTPQFAVMATAALAAVLLTPVALRQTGHASWSDFLAPARPEVLRDLPVNPDTSLLYPVSEAIEEQQPVFAWRNSGGQAAQIFLFDAAHNEIAHSAPISGAEWLAPVPLDRGAVYTWEVRTAAGARTASFRVLSQADHEKLAAARAANTPPARIGEMARAMGALSEAQRQFREELRRDPADSAARKQLDQVIRLRGR
jgi:anti-sigma factor ChrR (cupin superfamily)